MKRECAVLLPDIRSTYNVGSIFRTADAAGVSRIYLTGTTPTPIDRFGRKRKDIAKTALGAETTVPWEWHASASRLIRKLKTGGWRIVAVEQDPRSVHYTKLRVTKRTLLVFGAEVEGLPKKLRDLCDEIVEIPMHGKKESLNVSVAAGIVLYSIR